MPPAMRLRTIIAMLVCGVCLPSIAEEGSRLVRRDGPTATRLLAAPQATQAAAADRQFVYAVSDTTVAQYDRATGRLVQEATTADTRHLNSGFVFAGKVWCAHSNYPAEPPACDVRVFDPAAGTLAVHHVFSDPPGSLVWCVVKDGRWWCCFAHYGADNRRTVLVEYEPGGFDHERRRYTFPADVIAEWDGMSASGGIWHADMLLVSHHHDQVLYQLRLPTVGNELQLTAALHAPFPGQGIAVDPLTRGLVGIDRLRRAVVFASWPVKTESRAAGRRCGPIVVEDRAHGPTGRDRRPHGP